MSPSDRSIPLDRLRVLYLTPGCFDKGGISRYSRYQLTALREIVGARNVRALSILGPGEGAIEEPFSVDFHASGNRRGDKVAFVRRALAFAVRERPDLVHAAHVTLSGLAWALARSLGARALLNVYGLEVWSGMRRDAQLGLRAVDHVISDCHFTARYVETHAMRRAGKMSVVWDCVDIDKFSPGPPRPEVVARYGIPDPTTGINVLTLGRLTPEAAHKGYDRLLEVFSRVAGIAPSVRLVFAGRGPLVEVLRARAAAMGLGGRVHFTGSVHERDLPDVYRSAHVFSLVSDRGKSRGEGIPLTPLEAAACGVPILVGNQDGSQEAVIDGRNGYALDPFDFEAHAGKIFQLSQDHEARRTMAAVARSRIEREFSYTRFVAEHRVVLQSMFES